jgi:glycosyltransferase involved in cell wall biosynthesis
VAGPDLVLRGTGAHTLRRALTELAAHPLRSLATLATAAADALAPGEPLPAGRRLALLGQAGLALGLARWLRARGVRGVHCQFANATTGVGMYAARQLGVPFGFTGHANDLFDRRALLVRKLERAAWVSCISQWHREWYRGLCGARPERYALVRCGVDVAGWRPPDAPRPAGEQLRVAAVARLIPKKGIDVLLRALAELRRPPATPFRLVVAGDGPERPGLEALARELGCEGAVEFRGAVSNREVRALLESSDVLALPSRARDRLGDRDGIPVVLMEALALGVPVVAGDLPAVRELVEDGRSGFLVASEDVAALSDRLRRLARDPELRRRMGEAGRRRVEEEFALAPNLARLDAVLAQALGGAARS